MALLYGADAVYLAGQSFGNLFLAALNGMSPSFDVAVRRMSQVLAITGRVLPVTTADVQLEAEFENGATILGGCCGTAPEYIRAIAKVFE